MMLDPDRLPTDLDLLTKTFHEWHDKWQPMLDRWIAVNQAEQSEFARLLEPAVELLRLLINLVKDPSMAQSTRMELYKIINYVYDENDTLPEDEIGVVGLADDCVKMARMLESMLSKYTIQIKNNWSGKGEILDILEFILAHGDDLVKQNPV